MNEHDLKSVLRDTMANATVPPPMSETPVLEAGRRAKRRRRAGWAGAGSAAAVVAIAVGVVIVAPNSGDENPSLGVGVQSTETQPSESATPGDDTKTSWPNGQTDRTATSGPRYDNGLTLLDDLLAAVPSGLETPEGLRYEDPDYGDTPLRQHQASYDDTINGVEVWWYHAYIPVTKGSGLGEVTIEVITAGASTTGEGCALVPGVAEVGGTCVDVPVDGGTVGLITGNGTTFARTAVYRHTDGTVVHAGQSLVYEGSGKPAMTEPPLTDEQLVALAVEPKFKRA